MSYLLISYTVAHLTGNTPHWTKHQAPHSLTRCPEKRSPARAPCRAEIKPSLYSALEYLQKSVHKIFVGADALCVDQQDIPERTHQVRIMDRTYAVASKTAT